jgi:uncharacterized protein (TIGR02147 family)
MKLTISKILEKNFESRKKKNSRYSLRAFARDLGVSSGKLSEVMNQKITPGPKLLERILDRLDIGPVERARVFKQHLMERSLMRHQGRFQTVLTEDQYALIAQPEHFVIMSLLETHDFRSDAGWISARLNLPLATVELALTRLVDVGLLAWTSKGLKARNPGATTSEEIPSKILRDSHRAVINEALESLEKVAIDRRDITSITMAVNMSQLPRAKELIRKFRHRLCDSVQKGPKSEVYTLNVQFFPNTSL